MKLLLDTNIWLDYYLAGRAGHETAFELVAASLETDSSLFLASGSLKDVFYLIGQQLKRSSPEATSQDSAQAINEIAWGVLENMLELAGIAGTDASDVWIARKHKQLHADFEDNLIVAAAIRCNADYLITSDKQLLTHAPVAALSPEDALKLLEA